MARGPRPAAVGDTPPLPLERTLRAERGELFRRPARLHEPAEAWRRSTALRPCESTPSSLLGAAAS